MTTVEHAPTPGPQTPAQWAVRWIAVVAVPGLLLLVPLVHLTWHVVLGNEAPLLRTRSQEYAPEATWQNVSSGEWMLIKERELREATPITWWLRGHWNELRYRVGVPQSKQVHFGEDEWLFDKGSVTPNTGAFERATPKRLAFLGAVRDAVEAAGAELFVTVIPDKARVYADRAWPDGVVPANKADNYARILLDLRSLGIATVDLLAPMAAHRENPVPGIPPGELYYARDTHWRPPGALLTGYTVAAAIEQRFGDRLSERRQMAITGPTVVRAIGDLTGQLGILTVIEPDPIVGQRTLALSLLADRLAEPREYYGVTMRTEGGGDVPMSGKDPDAEILMVGTSFAEENGMKALSLALGRPVRGIVIRGVAAMKPIRAALAELRSGSRPKVVVWELVERTFFHPAWFDPEL